TPDMLADSVLQLHAVAYLGNVEAPVQNSLLAQIRDVTLHQQSVQSLLESVPAFSAGQLTNVFAILINNLPAIRGNALQTLINLSEQKGKPYSPWAVKLLRRL